MRMINSTLVLAVVLIIGLSAVQTILGQQTPTDSTLISKQALSQLIKGKCKEDKDTKEFSNNSDNVFFEKVAFTSNKRKKYERNLNRTLSFLSNEVTNTCVGEDAGDSLTSGIHNSFFGFEAGVFTTTGQSNSFFGSQTGLTNVTGSNLTLIGRQSNVGLDGLQFATAVGAGATVSANNTIQLGRNGLDTVRIGLLGSAGSTFLCQNSNDEISVCSGIPGSGSFIQNTTTQQPGSNFNISGNGVIGGNLSVGGTITTSLGTNGTTVLCQNGSGEIADCSSTNFVVDTDSRLTDSRDPNPGSGFYIQNGTVQQSASNFNISGTGEANLFNSATNYNIGGNRVLSVPLTTNVFIGVEAGINNIGNNNTLVGNNAGQNGTTFQNNSFFGFNAGKNTTSNNNSFFGAGSGTNTTGALNSFFGTNTGRDNTTGAGNSFFGESAGLENTTGGNNSFYGINAGLKNASGNSNSFFGANSGSNIVGGLGNSFFGANTGQFITSGNFNSFFGIQAGQNTTSANTNSFFGFGAGRETTTGGDNAFFGTGAGIFNTTGFVNTFIGALTGHENTSGNDNSYLGTRAGFFTTTGNRNSFVGSNTGDTNTTGSNNSALGSFADMSSGNLQFATAIGAGSVVTANDTIQLGRNGADTVRIGTTGAAGLTSLCLNANNEISTCSSSIRYKSNITNFYPGLNLVRKLRPVSFNWTNSGTPDVGFVAEEVYEVEPLLTTTKNGQVEGIKYDRIGAVLVNAVNEQQTQIEAQDKQIQIQQTQIEEQQKLIEQQNEKLKKQQSEIQELKEFVCKEHSLAEICKVK